MPDASSESLSVDKSGVKKQAIRKCQYRAAKARHIVDFKEDTAIESLFSELCKIEPKNYRYVHEIPNGTKIFVNGNRR